MCFLVSSSIIALHFQALWCVCIPMSVVLSHRVKGKLKGKKYSDNRGSVLFKRYKSSLCVIFGHKVTFHIIYLFFLITIRFLL